MTRIYGLLPPIAVVGVLGLYALAGCSVNYPDGKFFCGENSNCPPDMFCRADNRCYNSPDPNEESDDNADSTSAGRTTIHEGIEADPRSGAGGTIAGASGAGVGAETGGGTGGSDERQPADSGARDRGDIVTDSKSDIDADTIGDIDADAIVDVDAEGDDQRFSCDDETCIDQVTGLQWRRCVSGLRGSDCASGSAEVEVWQSAVDDCTDLYMAGKDDWRLPSIYELTSIIDFSKTNPSIDSGIFPNTPALAAWSSTNVLRPAEIAWVAAWGVHFGNGLIGYDQKTSDLNPLGRKAWHTRCVRGPKINARTFTKKDLVVLDDASSLMWQACSAGQTVTNCSGNALQFSWQDANDYCDTLNDYAGYNDWRLPNVRELLSLIDYTKVDPAVDLIAFPETQSGYYWSSTPIEGYPDHAWYVDFLYGHTKFDRGSELVPNTITAFVTRTYYVRCVRDEI
ncbi:MAG: DUF1566 domain-containing protein [Deltaproteobacteria bacterium]|nr:DUF1566 domain-containing protein [Deltaproteobacteria bacterium]